jgi:CBS domain-containing protein
MQARDIMTTNVIMVDPNKTVSEVARILLSRNIGAVPVVDASNHVLGIVSETDLLRRAETGTLKRRSWLAYFEDPSTLAKEYSRLHGTRARDVMNEQLLSVSPDADLLDVVDLMEKRGIRRVLVMEGDALHGIVCRSDLLRGMLASKEKSRPSDSDRGIRLALLEEIRDQPWRTVAGNNVIVTNGVVSFWGKSGSDAERKALRVAAENVRGVTRVEDHTTGAQRKTPVPMI